MYFQERGCHFEAMIGGYLKYTQTDPRWREKYQKYNIVLFELDSNRYPKKELGILWGDSGTGTFMMRFTDTKVSADSEYTRSR